MHFYNYNIIYLTLLSTLVLMFRASLKNVKSFIDYIDLVLIVLYAIISMLKVRHARTPPRSNTAKCPLTSEILLIQFINNYKIFEYIHLN